jgi:hypothetical protein
VKNYRKIIKHKCYTVLILFAFCLSSATLGSSLLYGYDAHFHQDNVHVHHTDKDHGLGGSDHKDANTILYLDYVVVNTTNQINTHSNFNPSCHSYNSSDSCYKLFNNISGIRHHSNKNSFCAHNLYQLNSSYLI